MSVIEDASTFCFRDSAIRFHRHDHVDANAVAWICLKQSAVGRIGEAGLFMLQGKVDQGELREMKTQTQQVQLQCDYDYLAMARILCQYQLQN